MSKQRIIDLGGHPQGSIPLGLTYQHLDGDGAPIDMTTGTWTTEAEAEQLHATSQPAPAPGGGVTAVVAITATVSYAWTADDYLTVGRFQLTIWAGNGTNRVGTPTFEWEVYDAPGALPAV